MNSLQDVPLTADARAHIELLNIEDSDITSLPRWFATGIGLVAASGSPVCSPPMQKRAETNVLCRPMDPNVIGRLTMAMFDEEIPLELP